MFPEETYELSIVPVGGVKAEVEQKRKREEPAKKKAEKMTKEEEKGEGFPPDGAAEHR